jgi:hypothetical protein
MRIILLAILVNLSRIGAEGVSEFLILVTVLVGSSDIQTSSRNELVLLYLNCEMSKSDGGEETARITNQVLLIRLLCHLDMNGARVYFWGIDPESMVLVALDSLHRKELKESLLNISLQSNGHSQQ